MDNVGIPANRPRLKGKTIDLSNVILEGKIQGFLGWTRKSWIFPPIMDSTVGPENHSYIARRPHGRPTLCILCVLAFLEYLKYR
jgi:hypothetical protein